jgi:hypothetical protein
VPSGRRRELEKMKWIGEKRIASKFLGHGVWGESEK